MSNIIKTARVGILMCILAKAERGEELSEDYKIKLRENLDWLILNENNQSKLAEYYNLRGEILAGKRPNLCK